jgi:UDP-N-acetylmuramate dehydrogenase
MEWKSVKGQVFEDAPMRRYTSMKVGGPAQYLIYPVDAPDLLRVVEIARAKRVALRFLGNGTNVIVGDRGLDCALIRIAKIRHIQFEKRSGGARVEVSGGISLHRFIRECARRGLSGLEKLYGIPGTIAGAIKMNAGSFGVAVSDHLFSVTYLGKAGKLETRQTSELPFGYRTSSFAPTDCILGAAFDLAFGEKREIEKVMEQVWSERWEKHPMELPSAGSIFKNTGGKPAWKYIDEVGLRGYRMGNACISEKHPNFIVNLGDARASDIVGLIRKVKQEVYDQLGVTMEEEVELWGCDG